MKVIRSRVSPPVGRQRSFEEIRRTGFPWHTVRISITSREFFEDCEAKIEVWDNKRKQWNELESLEPSDMQTPPALFLMQGNSPSPFWHDTQRLYNIATQVLGTWG